MATARKPRETRQLIRKAGRRRERDALLADAKSVLETTRDRRKLRSGLLALSFGTVSVSAGVLLLALGTSRPATIIVTVACVFIAIGAARAWTDVSLYAEVRTRLESLLQLWDGLSHPPKLRGDILVRLEEATVQHAAAREKANRLTSISTLLVPLLFVSVLATSTASVVPSAAVTADRDGRPIAVRRSLDGGPDGGWVAFTIPRSQQNEPVININVDEVLVCRFEAQPTQTQAVERWVCSTGCDFGTPAHCTERIVLLAEANNRTATVSSAAGQIPHLAAWWSFAPSTNILTIDAQGLGYVRFQVVRSSSSVVETSARSTAAPPDIFLLLPLYRTERASHSGDAR